MWRTAAEATAVCAAFPPEGQGWYETDFKKDNQRNLARRHETCQEDDKAAAGNDDDKGADKDKPSTSKVQSTG